jgi:hypothetical protein
LVDCGFSRVCFTAVRFLYLVLMPWVWDTWWNALGDYAVVVSCPSRQGLGYFYLAPLVIRPSPWWLSTVGVISKWHLSIVTLAIFVFLWFACRYQDQKEEKKEREKEERRFLASLELYL